MKDNAQRFLDAFSQLESVFKSWDKSGKSSSFSNYVHRYSKNHSLIRQYRDDLLEYSQLRNAIVHNRAGRDQIIAQPHDLVVEEIESIVGVLVEPALISEIKYKKLVTCQMDDLLINVITMMSKKGYPQLPILDGVMVKGVLTYHMIISYMLNHIENKIIDLEGLKVSNIVETIKPAEYLLVKETETVLSAIEAFGDYQQKGKVLSAIIVLNKESKRKGPIGILTSRDIPSMIKLVNRN